MNMPCSHWRAAILITGIATLVGCNATGGARPPQQSSAAVITNLSTQVQPTLDADQFQDSDIVMPAYFDTQGLEFCTYDIDNEDERCPLKRRIVRMYFDGAEYGGQGAGVEALANFDIKRLTLMLENQFAGINRFRVITRDDDLISAEQATFLEQQGSANLAERLSAQRTLATDYIVRLDTIRTARIDGALTSWMNYTLEITASVINPFTREILPYPNLGKIIVESQEVRSRDQMSFIMANGRYVRGFEFHQSAPVSAVLNDMASRGIDLLLKRMLSEMPSTAQVVGIRGNQISLDRGQNAGVLPNETMIIFEVEAGFVELLGVARVSPSFQSATGEIVRWKNSAAAEALREHAAGGIYRPRPGTRIFGVSVGTPLGLLPDRT